MGRNDVEKVPSKPHSATGVAGRRALPESPSLWVSVAVCALLLAAYLWSLGGSTTHVQIVASGGLYTVFIDGAKQFEARCEGPESGLVIVGLSAENSLGPLPGIRGLDRVLVTNLATGETRDEDFSDPIEGSAQSGTSWRVKDGVLTSNESALIGVGDPNWRDYRVDVWYRNLSRTAIVVHAANPANGVVYDVSPFRDFDNGLRVLAENERKRLCQLTAANDDESVGIVRPGEAPGSDPQMSKAQTMRSMLAMLLRPLPKMALTLSAALASMIVFYKLGLAYLLSRVRLRVPPGAVVAALACGAFALLLYISRWVNGGMPHVPDEISYLFQSKILASFHFSEAVPKVKEAFDFFFPSLLVESDGRWASIYPFGHPVLLAIGQLFGAPWVVGPILGAASVYLIYRVGRGMHGLEAGVLAAVLLAFSPFFQMTASNLMSHQTAMFYLLACMVCIVGGRRAGVPAYALGGVFFGLLLNTRPLTAVALSLPFALLFVHDIVGAGRERDEMLKRVAAFGGGFALLLGAFLLYNLATTGSLSSGYQSGGNLGQVLGFGERNSLARGLQNDQSQLAALVLVLGGWPAWVGLALVMLPFALGTRSRWDWFLLVAALCAMGIWTAYEASGIMHGPRYWYEALPFLALLSARGLSLAAQRLTLWARLVLPPSSVEPPLALGRAVTYGVLAILLAVSVHGWVLGKHFETDKLDFVPSAVSELDGFNGADDRLVAKVEEMGLHNALVLVKPCEHWQCYGTVFWTNNTGFDGDVVYAMDLSPESRAALLKAYAGRSFYLADYEEKTVVPLR